MAKIQLLEAGLPGSNLVDKQEHMKGHTEDHMASEEVPLGEASFAEEELPSLVASGALQGELHSSLVGRLGHI